MTTPRHSLPYIFLAALLSIMLPAEPQQQPPGIATPELGGANLPALPIGPEDLIAVSIYGSPELSRTVRVSSDGEIRLPMVRSFLSLLQFGSRAKAVITIVYLLNI